jgi:hypothetical protein
MAFLASIVTLSAEPAKEVKPFEAATDTMSKEEVMLTELKKLLKLYAKESN